MRQRINQTRLSERSQFVKTIHDEFLHGFDSVLELSICSVLPWFAFTHPQCDKLQWVTSSPPTPPKDADKELVQDTKESYEVSASSSSSSIPPPPISKDTSSNSSPLTPFRQLSSVARRFTTSASEQAVALTNVPARLLSGSGASTPRSESPSSSTQVTPSTSSTTPRKPQLSQDRQIPEAPVITQTPSSPTNQPSVSATSSNGTTIGDAAPAFDFQKFLDQMKMKNAEPVAKYLRS